MSGLVKKSFSKAAGGEVSEAYPSWYVERDARLRTPLEGFFTSPVFDSLEIAMLP
jgi:hypothetical protein